MSSTIQVDSNESNSSIRELRSRYRQSHQQASASLFDALLQLPISTIAPSETDDTSISKEHDAISDASTQPSAASSEDAKSKDQSEDVSSKEEDNPDHLLETIGLPVPSAAFPNCCQSLPVAEEQQPLSDEIEKPILAETNEIEKADLPNQPKSTESSLQGTAKAFTKREPLQSDEGSVSPIAEGVESPVVDDSIRFRAVHPTKVNREEQNAAQKNIEVSSTKQANKKPALKKPDNESEVQTKTFSTTNEKTEESSRTRRAERLDRNRRGDGESLRGSTTDTQDRSSLASSIDSDGESKGDEPSSRGPSSESVQPTSNTVLGPSSDRPEVLPSGIVPATPTMSPAKVPMSIDTIDSGSITSRNGVGVAGVSGTGSVAEAQNVSRSASTTTYGSITPRQEARLLQRVMRGFEQLGSGDGSVRLRLHPPQLGSLQMTIRMESSQMIARLDVETQMAHDALVENLPQLTEKLQQQGVKIEQFEVRIQSPQDTHGSETGNLNTSRDEGQQPSFSGHQSGHHPGHAPGRWRDALAAHPNGELLESARPTSRVARRDQGLDLKV